MKKTYLILGASSDMGFSLIQNLIDDNEEGANYYLHYYNNSTELSALVEKYPQLNIKLFQADFSDLNSVRKMMGVLGELDEAPTHIVSLTADAFKHTRFKEWDSESVNRDMTIQVYSLAEILRVFVPQMASNHYGKIVVMLTAYTMGTPPKNMSAYVTVKYALLGLVKSIASDYGDQGVNINGISPGMINTKFIDGIGRKIKEFTAQSNPKHRNLETSDVIPTIRLLLSDQAEFISGSNINLSGKTD